MALHTHGLKPGEMGFYDKYFGQLVGATILAFKMAYDKDSEGGEYWPTFLVKLADGQTLEIEISQDEEGNGPGFIFGLANPNEKEAA
jgi:hypothetical protein